MNFTLWTGTEGSIRLPCSAARTLSSGAISRRIRTREHRAKVNVQVSVFVRKGHPRSIQEKKQGVAGGGERWTGEDGMVNTKKEKKKRIQVSSSEAGSRFELGPTCRTIHPEGRGLPGSNDRQPRDLHRYMFSDGRGKRQVPSHVSFLMISASYRTASSCAAIPSRSVLLALNGLLHGTGNQTMVECIFASTRARIASLLLFRCRR